MNEIVAKFIEEQKKKQEDDRQKEKEKHLINLGLVDLSKVVKKYLPSNYSDSMAKDFGYIKSDEKGKFKYVWPDGKPIPLNVTDEEYQEICKICPKNTYKNKEIETNSESNSYAENVVTVLAWIILVIGVIGFITFCIIAGADYPFNWGLFAIGLGLLLTNAISWGVLLVLSNISRKLDRLK